MQALLYYNYTPIYNPDAFREEQLKLCRKLGLKGRILIANEGLNGTVCGEPDACSQYREYLQNTPGFGNMEWKIDEVKKQVFPRLRIVVREEIVTLGLKSKGKDVNIQNKAAYIEPEELVSLYEKGEEFLIIDGRNEYEGRIGRFKDAVVPDINAFRELPQYVKNNSRLNKYKDKPVITYCTGGIRCEKFSALLKENGFKNVKQLHGGIHKYARQTGGKYFEGEMYVFDDRIHVKVNKVNPSVISECKHCHNKISRYVNCKNTRCNEQFICCIECEQKFDRSCSVKCKELVKQNENFLPKQSTNDCGCM